MLTKEGIDALRQRLRDLRDTATAYFEQAQTSQDRGKVYSDIWTDLLNDEQRQQGKQLRTQVTELGVDTAGAARGSPLIAEADLGDLRRNTRSMLASIRFRKYRYRGVYIHHDEGVVLGVDPPSQKERPVTTVRDAKMAFNTAARSVRELLDLLSPAQTTQPLPTGTATYRPNTAFIMMPIDKHQPDLEDVKNGIKDVCREFGIVAITADDIEHDGPITERILDEIETNEFLIADLTGERPNVYYEIGHAHARDRRVILYRKQGTKVHFDVAHRNCPEYTNVSDLKKQLRKRLESLTNKPRKKV